VHIHRRALAHAVQCKAERAECKHPGSMLQLSAAVIMQHAAALNGGS